MAGRICRVAPSPAADSSPAAIATIASRAAGIAHGNRHAFPSGFPCLSVSFDHNRFEHAHSGRYQPCPVRFSATPDGSTNGRCERLDPDTASPSRHHCTDASAYSVRLSLAFAAQSDLEPRGGSSASAPLHRPVHTAASVSGRAASFRIAHRNSAHVCGPNGSETSSPHTHRCSRSRPASAHHLGNTPPDRASAERFRPGSRASRGGRPTA